MQTRRGGKLEVETEDHKQVSETLPTIVHETCSDSRIDVKSKISTSSRSALRIAELKEKQLTRQLELEMQLKLAKARNDVELARLQAELSDGENETCDDNEVPGRCETLSKFLRDCEARAPVAESSEMKLASKSSVSTRRTDLPKVELAWFDGYACNYWTFVKQFEYHVDDRT